jgi:hypothetical protein
MTLSDFFSNTYVQTIVLAFASAIIAALFARRPRVVWSKAHQSTFRFKLNEGEKPLYFYTSEIWVKNMGHAQAKNLEVVLNFKPRHYEIWTPRKFTEEFLADDHLALTFETLGPNDEFEISMLSIDVETPLIIEVRHEAGLASETKMQTTPKLGTFLIIVLATLILVGFAVILYQIAALFGPMIFSIP